MGPSAGYSTALRNPSPIYTSLYIDGRLTDGDEDEQDKQGEQDEMTETSDVLDEHTPFDVER